MFKVRRARVVSSGGRKFENGLTIEESVCVCVCWSLSLLASILNCLQVCPEQHMIHAPYSAGLHPEFLTGLSRAAYASCTSLCWPPS